MGKTLWQYRGTSDWKPSAEWLEAVGGSPLVAQLLHNRGIKTPEKAKAFLDLEHYQPTSGLTLPDMEVGVQRVLAAIEAQEPILIFGDFDVDGMTGTSVLYETLKYLGARVSYYIPDRATEGHGLNSAALIRLVSTRQVKLVISTDTGITNFNEVSLLNGLKVDCIITDHHDLPENLPPAVANINPKRLGNPDDFALGWLAGVGVAFKLCELLLEAKGAPPEITERLLDLVAIGTVADLAPLYDENRYLVYRGVQVLNRWQRTGVVELLDQAGTKPDAGKPLPKLTSETIGFVIGPRLNALGRLDNATQAVELLTTEDSEQARVIAAHLEHLNRKRQELCDKTAMEAETFLSRTGGLDGHRAIVLASPDWHLGVIGIVASRLIEKYHVPTFMMVIDEAKGEARCSARSIPGFNLHEAMVSLSDYFTHFGGHAGAGGFALKLEKLDAFKKALYDLTLRTVTDEQMLAVVEVDAKVDWPQLNPHLMDLIGQLEPYGKENPSPRFVVEDAHIGAQRQIGADGKHMKLILHPGDSRQPLDALIWNHKSTEKFDQGQTYHFVVSPGLNTFNNVTKLQLIVEDYRPAKATAMVSHTSNIQSRGTKGSSEAEGPSTVVSTGQTGPKWIDHRSRQSIETFTSQLMMPMQGKREVLVYHEGRPPQIPFLTPELLGNRLNLRPAQELILWDLPPDLLTFQTMIETVQPEVVHLVGGKYQSVPIYPALKDYLKIIYQFVPKVAHHQTESGQHRLRFQTLAANLASTQTVVYQGLLLLAKLGLAEIQIPPATDPHQGIGQEALISLRTAANPDVEATIAHTVEWVAFQHALHEVGRFRDWVLKTPLDQIKSSVLVQTETAPAATAAPVGAGYR